MRSHRDTIASSRAVLAFALSALVAGCGGAAAGGSASAYPEAEPFDGAAYIYEHAVAHIPLLAVREGRVEEAKAALHAAREPSARRGALRDLAFAHLVQAESAEEDEARGRRRHALRLAERAARSNRDEEQMRDLRFVRVWSAFRGGSENAAEYAAAFTERFQDHSETTRVAWMIEGELAFAREDWERARDAFRFVMASLDHPFYPYALFRTAQSYMLEGRSDEGRAGLVDVRDRACRSTATEADVRFGRAAWAELREPAPADPATPGRPAWCPPAEPVAGSAAGLR